MELVYNTPVRLSVREDTDQRLRVLEVHNPSVEHSGLDYRRHELSQVPLKK